MRLTQDERFGPATLHARFFAPTCIYFRGLRIDAHLSAQGIVVLAYIMTYGEDTIKREELAMRLWPDMTIERGKATLRSHLYRLKELCAHEPPFRCTARTIAVESPWAIWSDVATFRAFAANDRLDDAIALHRGPFLPYVDHEWIATERDDLQAALCSMLRLTARRRYANGDLVGALQSAERLHAFDPWHEDVARTIAALRCSIGDRAGALATIARFRQRLREDLAVDPMPETLRFFDALARGERLDPFDVGRALTQA